MQACFLKKIPILDDRKHVLVQLDFRGLSLLADRD
jgi:hypothetical protein